VVLEFKKHISAYLTLREAQSTDHELIPQGMPVLAAMQSSASGSNVTYYPPRKHEIQPARYLQLGYESLRILIADQ
jgi:hypothetical protein